MPYVKSISIRNTIARSIAYILNPEKTEDLIYTTSLNCMANPVDAYLNMKLVYEQFSGKKYDEPIPNKGKGRVKAIHYIQSFSPDENITPEQAHRMGKAFARKTFGDNCQIVIATHCDKKHIHNHFILNTYGIDGQKFNDNQTTLNHIREYSDRVCLAFGIQPIQAKSDHNRTIEYNEWKNKQRGTSWKQQIRLEIDRLIDSAKNLDELLYELELLGYTVKSGKYISIKVPEQERFVRTKTLGEDYTEQSLISRIRCRDVGANVTLTGELSQLREDYTKAIADVTELVKGNQKIKRKRNASASYSAENDMDVYKLSAQLTIINRDNIHSIGELEGKIEKLKKEYANATTEINGLIVRQEHLTALVEQAEKYYELADKDNLSSSEKLQLRMLSETLRRNNIQSKDDLDKLKTLKKSTDEKVSELKHTYENCKRMYEVYSDIVDTYQKISRGDYISNLIEEKKKQEQEAMKKKSYRR